MNNTEIQIQINRALEGLSNAERIKKNSFEYKGRFDAAQASQRNRNLYNPDLISLAAINFACKNLNDFFLDEASLNIIQEISKAATSKKSSRGLGGISSELHLFLKLMDDMRVSLGFEKPQLDVTSLLVKLDLSPNEMEAIQRIYKTFLSRYEATLGAAEKASSAEMKPTYQAATFLACFESLRKNVSVNIKETLAMASLCTMEKLKSVGKLITTTCQKELSQFHDKFATSGLKTRKRKIEVKEEVVVPKRTSPRKKLLATGITSFGIPGNSDSRRARTCHSRVKNGIEEEKPFEKQRIVLECVEVPVELNEPTPTKETSKDFQRYELLGCGNPSMFRLLSRWDQQVTEIQQWEASLLS